MLGKDMLVTAIFQRFVTGHNPVERRREEALVLHEMNTDSVFCTMCGVQIPKEIMLEIFQFFGFGRSLLDTVGLVCWEWFVVMYSSWTDEIWISRVNLVIIPTVVLKRTKGIILDFAKNPFVLTSYAHLFPLINPKRLERLEIHDTMIETFKLRQFMIEMKNQIGLLPALRHLTFPKQVTEGEPFDFTFASMAPNLRILDYVPCLDWIVGLEKLEELKFNIASPFRSKSLLAPLASCSSLRVCELCAVVDSRDSWMSAWEYHSQKAAALPGMCHLLQTVEVLRLMRCDRLTKMTFTSLPRDFICPRLKDLQLFFCGGSEPPAAELIAFRAPMLEALTIEHRGFQFPLGRAFLPICPVPSKSLLIGANDSYGFVVFDFLAQSDSQGRSQSFPSVHDYKDVNRVVYVESLHGFLSEIWLVDLPTDRESVDHQQKGVQKDEDLLLRQFSDEPIPDEPKPSQMGQPGRGKTVSCRVPDRRSERRKVEELFQMLGKVQFSFASFRWTSPKNVTVVFKPMREIAVPLAAAVATKATYA